MPAAESPEKLSPEKLSIVVFSGDFDRVHYALVMAAAAAATNRPVTLFFTMWAARALQSDQGWRRMRCSDGSTATDLDAQFQNRGVADFETLLDSCGALGVTVMVCEMGLRALGIEASDLRPEVPIATGGVVTFLADASKDGAMLFI